MKELTIEQMEHVTGGSLKKFFTCATQVGGGMGVLITLAAIGIYATSPAGWLAFGVSVLGLAAGVASDPSACD